MVQVKTTNPSSDQQEAAGKRQNKSWLSWINEYFSRGIKTDRFDGFAVSNDGSRTYFDTRIHLKATVTRACVSVEAVAFHEIAQDADMIYVPCGISSGLRAHEALGAGATTTYKVDEKIAGTRHKNAIAMNKDDNLRRAAVIGRMYPDKMVVAPVVREGAVREITHDGAFSRWQRYEEEDFMAFWYPVIDRCKVMVLDGDWNFSRNSIWEMMRGVLIQAGQVPSRPGADMEVNDLEGNPVTLLWRAKKLEQMLKYQLGKGFDTREAATALAQIFTLDEEIRAGKIPAEGRKLYSVLANRSTEELAAMEVLKAELKPILLNQCAKNMRLDDLPEEYKEAAKSTRKLPSNLLEAFQTIARDISKHANAICSVIIPPALLAKDAKIAEVTRPQRMFDSYERFFEKRSRAKMFEDNLYEKLQQWERLALPFAIGATETGLYPTGHPMSTMILTDPKRGTIGKRRAEKEGVDNIDELTAVLGRESAEVIAENVAEAEAQKAALKQAEPHKIVVNSLSFLRIADAINKLRPEGFIAAKGAEVTSPQMRLALQMKYLDRNVDRAVFQEGWQHSPDLVQLRVRARLIQAGMVERPTGAQSTLTVESAANPGMPETLLEDIKILTQDVRRGALTNTAIPEQALALARLIALHELIIDPALRKNGDQQTRDIINTLAAPPSLVSYDREEAKLVATEAKTLLLTKAALWLPPERLEVPLDASDDADRKAAKEVQNHLMQGYLSAQTTQRGDQRIRTQSPPTNPVIITGVGR